MKASNNLLGRTWVALALLWVLSCPGTAGAAASGTLRVHHIFGSNMTFGLGKT